LKLSLPYSHNRRYLTGIDWAIGTLDYVTRQATGVGNLSQVVLELEGSLSPDRLRGVLAQISDRFPLIHGRVARDRLNLAPYWKIPRSRANADIPLKVVDLPADANLAAAELFVRHVNTPLRGETQHLRFLLVRLGDGKSRLGLVFDHKLLDAYGAEAFLQLIDETWHGRLETIAAGVNVTEAAHLDRWTMRLARGRTINRFRLELSPRDVIAPVLPPRCRSRAYRFVHATLSPDQADRFEQLAGEEAGVPILLPSAIARSIVAMRPALAGAAWPGTQYLVAVSVDARPADQKWQHLFFNHLSFLAFSAPLESAGSVEQLLPVLSRQFVQQMRDGVPSALQEASMLMRICPYGLGSRLARIPFKGRMCSFYFACLRNSAFTAETFLGLGAVDLIHTPRVPPPPGVGICLTSFRGQIKVVLSYLEGVLDDRSAQQVMRRLKSRLI